MVDLHAGTRLASYLRQRKKTKAALARHLDVSKQAVGKWILTGQIARERIKAICDYLEITTDELLGTPQATNVRPIASARSAKGSQSARLDLAILTAAVETLEKALAETRKVMTPPKKAALIATIYELFADSNGKVESGTVIRLIRSVA